MTDQENFDSQNTIEESTIDNSNNAPETDNANIVEPVIDNALTGSNQDEQVNSETNTEENNSNSVNNQQVDPEISKEFMTKFFGEDVDINSLSDREKKISKSAYHSEKRMNELNQKNSELTKSQESEKLQQEEQSIKSSNTALDSEYRNIHDKINTEKQNYQKQISKALEDGQIDTQQYTLDFEKINEHANNQLQNLNQNYNKLSSEQNQKKEDFNKQQISTIYKQQEDIYKEKFLKPEYKIVLDKYKKAGYHPDDIPFVVEAVDEAIEAYKSRKNIQAKNTKAISRMNTSVNNNTQNAFNSNHIFTAAEIGKMSKNEFIKNEKRIDEQRSKI